MNSNLPFLFASLFLCLNLGLSYNNSATAQESKQPTTQPATKPQQTKTDSDKQSSQSPPLWEELNSRKDKLGFENLVSTSTVEAEKFRQSLLAKKNGFCKAQLIARACQQFAKLKLAPKKLTDANQKAEPKEQYSLGRFELTPEQIVDAIAGKRTIPNPSQFYGSFKGKWYGIWDGNEVDHHWGPYVVQDPAKVFQLNKNQSVKLVGYQYAWVGDGYGLNHVASSADGTKNFLLGYVIHLKDKDIQQEVIRRPHVGVVDGTDRLVWITRSEVFFEEMIRGKGQTSDRYYITGFRYSIDEAKNTPNATLSATDSFQVVYSRDANQRQPWRGFKIDLKIQSK